MRRVVVSLADTHGGHKLGLLNPDTVLWEEDENGDLQPHKPALTHFQLYLWQAVCEDRQKVIELAGRDELIILHNGDLTQGIRFRENLVSSGRLSDQIEIAFRNLLPWVALPNVQTARVVIGTGVHNMGEGASERLVTRLLKERFPEKDVTVLRHSLLDIGGVTFDVAHHGPHPGSRDWLKGNVARLYLRDLMTREVKSGNVPPRVVARAHYHKWVRVTEYDEIGGTAVTSDLVILPSYCGLDDHAQKATQSVNVQTHGCVAFELVDGELRDIHPFKRSLDLRTKETL